jgi:hypothetical protein
MNDPLSPPLSVLCKLGSIAVHAGEWLSLGGHQFDVAAFKAILQDPEVKEWIAEMNKQALLPVVRS